MRRHHALEGIQLDSSPFVWPSCQFHARLDGLRHRVAQGFELGFAQPLQRRVMRFRAGGGDDQMFREVRNLRQKPLRIGTRMPQCTFNEVSQKLGKRFHLRMIGSQQVQELERNANTTDELRVGLAKYSLNC